MMVLFVKHCESKNGVIGVVAEENNAEGGSQKKSRHEYGSINKNDDNSSLSRVTGKCCIYC